MCCRVGRVQRNPEIAGDRRVSLYPIELKFEDLKILSLVGLIVTREDRSQVAYYAICREIFILVIDID